MAWRRGHRAVLRRRSSASGRPSSEPSFDLAESKLRPPLVRPGIVARTALVDRLVAASASSVHLRRRPGWLREDDVAGAVGRTQETAGGMGQRRRPRQRPCRPPDLHRRGAGPHRADRPESVPRARLVRRRHRGSAAAGLRDGEECGTRSRSSSTTSKWSRTRRVSTRSPRWHWDCRWVRSLPSVRETRCPCQPRACVRRAASWRLGSTIWRWIRTRRARCSWRRGSSSPARTSMSSSAGPRAGRSACTSPRWR